MRVPPEPLPETDSLPRGSVSGDVSPPAHLLPSDLLSDSPPPPGALDGREERGAADASVLPCGEVCGDAQAVDEATLRKACEIVNLATNIKGLAKMYQAGDVAGTIPIQEISPTLRGAARLPDEVRNDLLPFSLLNEVFDSSESSSYTNRCFKMRDISHVSPYSEVTGSLERTGEQHLFMPLQELSSPQSVFETSPLNVTPVQVSRAQETIHGYTTSPLFSLYEPCRIELGRELRTRDAFDYQESRSYQPISPYCAHNTKQVAQHTSLPTNKYGIDILKGKDRTEEYAKLPTWLTKEIETVQEPVNQRDRLEDLIVTDVSKVVSESQQCSPEFIDLDSIESIWDYKIASTNKNKKSECAIFGCDMEECCSRPSDFNKGSNEIQSVSGAAVKTSIALSAISDVWEAETTTDFNLRAACASLDNSVCKREQIPYSTISASQVYQLEDGYRSRRISESSRNEIANDPLILEDDVFTFRDIQYDASEHYDHRDTMSVAINPTSGDKILDKTVDFCKRYDETYLFERVVEAIDEESTVSTRVHQKSKPAKEGKNKGKKSNRKKRFLT